MFEFEYDAWEKEGFSRHEAFKWRLREFTLEEAIIWRKHGFEVGDAQFFRMEEKTPEEAKEDIIEEIKTEAFD